MTSKDARLISYIRVSDMGERDESSESTQTIRQQREANEAIAKLSHAVIVDEVVALNASGGKAWPEPKLQEIIERVDAGEADGVVVYALDRWGRSLQALEVIERWAEEGKTMLSAGDKFDATTPSGRVSLRLMMVIARYYWEMTRDRFMVSQRAAFERGAHIARTPFGYVRVTDELDPRVGCLDRDPEWGPVVTKAFTIAAGESLHAAKAYLEDVAPHRGWDMTDVRRVLSNRAYLGEVKLNGDVKENAHAPLTTLSAFLAAQTEPRTLRASGNYPLSGIARCETCGGPMAGQYQTFRDGRAYRRMRCKNQPVCTAGASIGADRLEAYVQKVVAEVLSDKRWRVKLDPGGAEEALRVLEEATAERLALAMKMSPSHPTYQAVMEQWDRIVDEAEADYRERASRSMKTANLPAATQLNLPDQLERVLGVLVDRIDVRPGRGSVEDRATIVWR